MQNHLNNLVQPLLTVHYINDLGVISIQPGSWVGFPPHVELRSAWIFLPALLLKIWLQYQCSLLKSVFRSSTTLLKSRGVLSLANMLPSVPKCIPWYHSESFSLWCEECWGCLLVPCVFLWNIFPSNSLSRLTVWVQNKEMMHHLVSWGSLKAETREEHLNVAGNILLLNKCIWDIYSLKLWWIGKEEWEYTKYIQGNWQSHL